MVHFLEKMRILKIPKNNEIKENRTFTGILKSIFAIGIVASASLLIHFHALRIRASWTLTGRNSVHKESRSRNPEKA